MKLYYHQNTPTDYEPPCFRPAESTQSRELFWFSESPLLIKAGEIGTPWHELRLCVHTKPGAFEGTEEEERNFSEENEFLGHKDSLNTAQIKAESKVDPRHYMMEERQELENSSKFSSNPAALFFSEMGFTPSPPPPFVLTLNSRHLYRCLQKASSCISTS